MKCRSTYIVEVFEDRGEGPAGWTPVCREVEEDNFLAGQGLVRGHRASVGAGEVLAGQKFHDEDAND